MSFDIGPCYTKQYCGVDYAYVKSYKFKKRVTAIVLSILAVIMMIVASLSIYIYIENEKDIPIYYNDKIIYKDDV